MPVKWIRTMSDMMKIYHNIFGCILLGVFSLLEFMLEQKYTQFNTDENIS